MRTPTLLLTGLCLMPLMSGCVTSAMWRCTARREWKPIAPDQVLLLTDTNQQHMVVVLFRQGASVGRASDSRNVGWCLGQSPGQLALTRKALCQLTSACAEYISIPLFWAERVPETASSVAPGYAVWNETDAQLTVHIDGLPPGPFTLPTTRQDSNTVIRATTLPLTIAADAAICLAFVLDGFNSNSGMGAFKR